MRTPKYRDIYLQSLKQHPNSPSCMLANSLWSSGLDTDLGPSFTDLQGTGDHFSPSRSSQNSIHPHPKEASASFKTADHESHLEEKTTPFRCGNHCELRPIETSICRDHEDSF